MVVDICLTAWQLYEKRYQQGICGITYKTLIKEIFHVYCLTGDLEEVLQAGLREKRNWRTRILGQTRMMMELDYQRQKLRDSP